MNKKWWVKRWKYILALALIAVIALLLCFEGTRKVLFGLFGYAVVGYLLALSIACVMWMTGRHIELGKGKVALYLGLFFAFLATLHVGLTENLATDFSRYIIGTFDVPTPGGIVVAIITSVFAIPLGYLPSLLIFFVMTAGLGLLAILPLLKVKDKTKRERVVKKAEPKEEERLLVEAWDDPSTALFPAVTKPEPMPRLISDVEFAEVKPKQTAYETLFSDSVKSEIAEQTHEEPMLMEEVLPQKQEKKERTKLKTDFYTNNSLLDARERAYSVLQTDNKTYYDMRYSAEQNKARENSGERLVQDASTETRTARPVVQDTSTEIRYARPVAQDASTETRYARPAERTEEAGVRYAPSENVGQERANTQGDQLNMSCFEREPMRGNAPAEQSETSNSRGGNFGYSAAAESFYVDDQRSARVSDSNRVSVPQTAVPIAVKTEERKEDTRSAIAKRIENRPYMAPPIELLDPETDVQSAEIEDYAARKQIIENTIMDFGIETAVVSAVKGPAVTCYELKILTQGVNVKRVNAAKENLQMNLAVSSVSIFAPIKGKSLIGIEIPNIKRSVVKLRTMLNAPEFNKKEGKVVFAIGKTVDNRAYVFDMVDAPHMMVAGTSGSGKSVCLNVIILSLIYRYSPEEMRFVMIDPKRVEMSVYREIPHMLVKNPVVDVPEAINMLRWACDEMDRRYDFLMKNESRDIDSYNKHIAKDGQKMFRIIIFIDEMADLMMRAKGQVEEYCVRIAQMGRAAGIHLVLATQRPSANIITNMIKSNISTVIACTTKTNLESRIIMDEVGAENLLGRGDLYFTTPKEQDKVRIQSAFVDDPEVKRICNFLREHNEAHFDQEIELAVKVPEPIDVEEAQAKMESDNSERANALVKNVMRTFILMQRASISLAQMKHSIGYQKASRIVNQLEEMGCISQDDGKNARKVMISMEDLDRIFPNENGAPTEF